MGDSPSTHPNSGASGSVSEGGLGLMIYIRALKRSAWWIFLLAFCGSALIGLWTMSKPRLYVAKASVVPPLDALDSRMVNRGLSSQLSQMLDKGGSIPSLLKTVLESQAVADVIIVEFDLVKVYESKDLLAAREKLGARTTITLPRASSVVVVEVMDEDPNRAVTIANAYIEQLDKLNRSLLGGEATNKRAFLGKRLQEIEQDFNNVVDLKSREVRIKEMLYELVCREYELAKIEEAKSLPTVQVLDRASLPAKPVGRGVVRRAGATGASLLIIGMLVAFARGGLL